MKIKISLLTLFLCLFSAVKGQAPGKFNYQAVARNTAGNLIINQNISVRVSILTGGTSGTSEYTETHSVTTDAFGVFNLLVGGGSVVSGTFTGITWGTASKFLKIEADVTGGTTYQAIATTQILSAPYALYANESGTKTFNDNEFSIIYAGGIADNPSTAPSATLAGMGAGSVDNGTHDYKVTFITSAGETGAGPASGLVTVANNASNGKVLVSGIPVSGKTNVTSRNLYRRFNSTGDFKLLTTISDNSTTTYIDNTSNSLLGIVLPGINGTTNNLQFDASNLTNNRKIIIPDKSGTLVLNEENNIPLQTKTDRSLILHGRSIIQDLIRGAVNFGYGSGEFADAYIDADGRNNTVNITTDNTLLSFDINKYKYKDWTNEPHVIIEASFVSALDFNINNCLAKQIESDKWIIYSTSGSDAVKRAQVYKTLYYGTNGSDPRLSTSFVNSLRMLRTSISRDVGKRGYFRTFNVTFNGVYGSGHGTVDDNFTNTTDNSDVSMWGISGAIDHTTVSIGPWFAVYNTNFNLTGTDTESTELDNPPTLRYRAEKNDYDPSNGTATLRCIVLSKEGYSAGTPTYANGASGGTVTITTNTLVDIALKNLTSSDFTSTSAETITHNIPTGTFNSNISKAFFVPLIADWEDGCDIQFMLSNTTESSGWFKYNTEAIFTPFTSQPTKLTIKLIPKSSNPAVGNPSISGFYITEF